MIQSEVLIESVTLVTGGDVRGIPDLRDSMLGTCVRRV